MFTFSGITKSCREEQFLKTLYSIVFRPSGNSIFLILTQFSNAELFIFVTVSGIFTVLRFVQSLNNFDSIVVTPFGIVTLSKQIHSLKTALSITVRLLGRLITDKELHLLKALYPIFSKPSPKPIFFNK